MVLALAHWLLALLGHRHVAAGELYGGKWEWRRLWIGRVRREKDESDGGRGASWGVALVGVWEELPDSWTMVGTIRC